MACRTENHAARGPRGPSHALGGIWAAVLIAWCSGCSPTPPPVSGAVLLSCQSGEAAARAGIEPGDVVTGWERNGEGGPIGSPFDLLIVEQEQAPRGPVVLTVRRGRREARVEVATGRWFVRSRPVLGKADSGAVASAESAIDQGHDLAALAVWRGLAEKSEAEGRPLDAAWFRLQAGTALARIEREEESAAELELGSWGVADPSLSAAYWDLAGTDLLDSGKRSAAETAFSKALDLKEGVAPRFGSMAFTLNQLARTDMRRYEDEARRAVELFEEIQGEGLETAAALNTVGAKAYIRSELDLAESVYRRSLEITERLAPGSGLETKLLGNLGLVALKRGDLDTARLSFRRALDLAERVTPLPVYAGYAANYLGLVAKNLGDYEGARVHYERALEVFRLLRPGGEEVAGALNNLGNVALRQGAYRTAERFHTEALALRTELSPDSTDVAWSLSNLGTVARQEGRLSAARQYLERAIELKRRLAPGTLWLANSLFELGEVAGQEGELGEAQRLHREALGLRRAIAPGSADLAESLDALGKTAYREGRTADAERFWRRAIAGFEAQRGQLELSVGERSVFGALFYGCYGNLARLLSESGRDREAFDLLERARACAMRAMLAERRFTPPGVPVDLLFALRRVQRQIDRTQARLKRVNVPEDGASVAELNKRIGELEGERDALGERIRELAPRFASFAQPEARGFDEVRASLDPGTVLLSYSVGKESSLLFVVGAEGSRTPSLRAVALPVGRRELDRRVETLRAFIERGRDFDEIEPALVARGRKLFELLVQPVFDEVAGARRLLIVPDGPLTDLPFAALVIPGDELVFLGQWKTMFFNASAGVFAELKETRRQGVGTRCSVVAFGDPEYSPGSPVTQRWSLKSLEGSRREVEDIAALFGDGATVYLGGEATKERVRNLRKVPRFLHLAVHATPNRRFPMESALFFASPGRSATAEDCVLKAWEILELGELDLDVVTLSSCGTAAGRPVAGEGIVGLARAFQYAGARTVVASRWAVSDRSTGRLMTQFYSLIRDGLSTADALHAAQRALIETSPDPGDGAALDGRHPFHWAAFQVIGDWE